MEYSFENFRSFTSLKKQSRAEQKQYVNKGKREGEIWKFAFCNLYVTFAKAILLLFIILLYQRDIE